MSAIIKLWLLFIFPITVWASTSETVFFLSDDLETATKYYNSREQNTGNPAFLFNENFDREKILYARPENYKWKKSVYGERNYQELGFYNTPGYAYLKRKTDGKFLTKLSPTRYQLRVDGSECHGNLCSMDENIIAVVIPKRFNVLSYDSSVNGNWKVVDSTYTFYSKNVKGASVELILEDQFAIIYSQIFDDMSTFDGIEVENEGDQINVVMPMDNVFGSGSTHLNNEGKDWVKQLAQTLSTIQYQEVRVEGHADSIPVRAGSIYPSNWELSAARAAMALRLLKEQGVPGSKLVAVGYGDSRPVASNANVDGRAQNRRIAFSIIPESEDTI
ncbi:flagellar motor protein MotB [Endozoicomonas montiporae]|uniref:Flagellar motor protein MotB n=1 Tax=Endozoicomonas montiporae CL-33 TaxID=570277 RepID=A0A142BH05_9GAMM|nr:OmpA family protein [Endozoicomonas montiporae]AMO58031.1 flagellar motor protein MotB [Endozoicomonas montiporae CL-33]